MTTFQQSIRARARNDGGPWGDAGAPVRIFAVGVPARDVVGLPEKRFDVACSGTPLDTGMSQPGPVAVDSVRRRLFVSDRVNHRVLVFQLSDAGAPESARAIAVIGQPDFMTCGYASAADNAIDQAQGLAVDAPGGRLFVADSSNNRVLVFDVVALDAGLRATQVLGQASMAANTGSVSPNGMRTPTGLAYGPYPDGGAGLLFVSDSNNNRVLVFDVPTAMTAGQAASSVLGQINFSNATPDSGAAKLNTPMGLAFDTSRRWLYVSDWNNNRVLVFDVATIDAGEDAFAVLGQPNFTSTGSGVSTMSAPTGLALDADGGNRLFVADPGNHRVLVYDTATVDSGESPLAVVGQPDFASNQPGVSASRLSGPRGVATIAAGARQRLYVGDSDNSRIVGFDLDAVTNGIDASALLGHGSLEAPVFSSGCINGPNNVGFETPIAVAIDPNRHRLFVADLTRHRILVFTLDAADQLFSQTASAVIGQPDFASCSTGTTSRALNSPRDLAFDSKQNRLFVADDQNRRVVVFALVGDVTNNMAASAVIGQSTVDAVDAIDAGTVSQSRFGSTLHIDLDADGGRLFLADGDNHRVLVFDVTPGFPNGANAGTVLGQPNFNSGSPAPSASGFNTPRGLAFDPGANRLFVADRSNRRVLVFNTSAIANNMSAEFVFGQPDFNASTSIPAGDGGLSLPTGVALDKSGSTLFVSDIGFNRIAAFDLTRLANGLMASTALGQPTFSAVSAGISSVTVNEPAGLVASPNGGGLFVADISNRRVLVFDIGP